MEGVTPGRGQGFRAKEEAITPLGPVRPEPQEAAALWDAPAGRTPQRRGALYPLFQSPQCCLAPLATPSGSPLSWAEGEQTHLSGKWRLTCPAREKEGGMREKGAEWTAVTVSWPIELGLCHMTLVRMRNLTVVPPDSSLLWSPGRDSGHPVYCEVKRTHCRHPGSPGAPSQRGLE